MRTCRDITLRWLNQQISPFSMTIPFRSAVSPQRRVSPLYTTIFLALSALIALRIAVNGRLLNSLMAYEGEGGTIIEKIHPTFWGLLAVGLVGFGSLRIELRAWDLAVLRALLAFCGIAAGLLAFAGIVGRSASVGYLLDSHVTVLFIALTFAFPSHWRRALGSALLAYMVLGAMLAIVEVTLRFRLMPFEESEPVFRPTGLSSHPLDLGLWCAVGLCFTAATGWSLGARLTAGTIFFIGAFASGARLATLITLICALVLLIAEAGTGLSLQRRRQRRLIVFLVILLIIPIIAAGLFTIGGLGRFDSALVDQNAMARIQVYGVFGSMSWPEIVLGGDINSILKLVNINYNLPFIESSLVVYVVQFGIVGTVLLLGSLVRLAHRMVANAHLGGALAVWAFLIISLSNNTLSTKTSAVFLIVTLGITIRPDVTYSESAS